MEQWQKDLMGIVETVAEEVERFFQGMNDMVDSFFDLTEELTEEVQNNIAAEVEQYLQEISAPFLEMYWELEDIVTDADPGFPYSVEATPEQNSACVGCTNYHGQVYGGNLLVCAMHPHGWDYQNCPDWEQE
ncbi:hypothetical protein NIES21_41970 [Anabaenopsis circularis NIES-21]|uniref:Uncharacterized protein n=1 Tax=Anabaenopsis circularis NIES-21 TaxID=1085406 RepID=A0A1Z4GLG3_9CYAN|nr:hypothetical protein NIES21_41970 [Anabaenopsis circularis NIES-21]